MKIDWRWRVHVHGNETDTAHLLGARAVSRADRASQIYKYVTNYSKISSQLYSTVDYNATIKE